jgi:hypothetical protein
MFCTISKKHIEKTVEQMHTRSPSGTECTFVKLNKKWGIKLYWDERVRDSNYEWQKKCEVIGLAPETGDIINFQDNEDYDNLPMEDKYPLFGYITEVVETFADYTEYQSAMDWRSAIYARTDHNEEYKEQYDEMCKKLCTINFDTSDLWWGNVGFKNGKMICIDFGWQY